VVGSLILLNWLVVVLFKTAWDSPRVINKLWLPISKKCSNTSAVFAALVYQSKADNGIFVQSYMWAVSYNFSACPCWLCACILNSYWHCYLLVFNPINLQRMRRKNSLQRRLQKIGMLVSRFFFCAQDKSIAPFNLICCCLGIDNSDCSLYCFSVWKGHQYIVSDWNGSWFESDAQVFLRQECYSK
jgi:hypothetical protein